MSQGVERVLELGCGYGRDAVYLANQGFDVTAVDFSAAALALANSWTMRGDGAGRLDYLRDNLVDLDLAESAYDAVFSHRTLHLVVSRERLNKAFAEIHRVLKPGGTACVSLRNPRDPTQAKTHGSGGEYSEVSFRPGHRILFLSDAELTEIVEPHFSIVAHEEVQERESRTQNYEAALHFLVLSK
nr:class I SAM-dependent methyltransferase [Gammaproteobacteria bacterium]NIR88805.1 class I SAM-dependent methyltransferase [Gammaproteobacteria bacterium]NIU06418.1 class I SAM-dependent methyltransferase [Gammaproteobacteria bacterium]NIV53310.1 methyltransferase domain-containing protein [Gammaproteobacteria bacterium]NIX87691.1 methyltransferase domain-containing protein [Gammaproteobacteria bacterium]